MLRELARRCLRSWQLVIGGAVALILAAGGAASLGHPGLASVLGGVAWATGGLGALTGLVATSRLGRRIAARPAAVAHHD